MTHIDNIIATLGTFGFTAERGPFEKGFTIIRPVGRDSLKGREDEWIKACKVAADTHAPEGRGRSLPKHTYLNWHPFFRSEFTVDRERWKGAE